MRIEILADAEGDLLAGYQFYERQASGLGRYFRDSLFEDIDALSVHGGVHAKIFGYHRSLSKRFPFAIYRGEYCPRPCRVGLPPPTFVDQAHSWRQINLQFLSDL